MSIIEELFFERFADKIPFLEHSLRTARVKDTASLYLKKSLVASFFFSLILVVGALFLVLVAEGGWFILPILFVIFFPLLFYMFLNRPRYMNLKAGKEIESEIVSAVRFMILELKTQRSLYAAIKNTAENFVLVGIFFDEIIHKVELGYTLEDAIAAEVEICPSANLRVVYWQLLNTLQTGADITITLETLLDQIIEEQKIKIEEYGRELNALSLFYMMLSFIIPTIGFTIITAILTFAGISVGLGILLVVWVLLSLMQYLFLMTTVNRRPSVEAY